MAARSGAVVLAGDPSEALPFPGLQDDASHSVTDDLWVAGQH